MLSKVKTLINSAGIIISYSALQDEINPVKISFIKNFSGLIVTVPNKNFPDPFAYSVWLNNRYSNQQTILLIPGQRFDLFGMRHGRGDGWYDRLLSKLPPHWQRIGVTEEKNLTRARLPRQPHDQLVDWLIFCVDGDWRAFETGARSKMKKEKSDDTNLEMNQ